jgi:hypothetical protein
MVWHIFQKDWKLLWPMVVGVALINLIHRVILSNMGIFRSDPLSPLSNLSGIFEPICLFATAILVVMVVQQDALPGLRHDWLVRPIRRRDLMLSKILFVALMVQGPIFIAEVGQGLAAGFSLPQSLGGPLSGSLWLLLGMDLPLLAFATLTRNLMEAIGAGLLVVLGYAFFSTPTLNLGEYSPGVAWIGGSVRLVWGVLAVAVVLGLQYYRRKTIRARWVFGGSALVWLLAQLLPWQAAFAIQQRLSPRPAAANPVQIAFDPSFGRIKLPRSTVIGRFPRTDIYVPLRVTDGGYSGMLIADRMTAHLAEPDGRAIGLGLGIRSDTLTRGESYQLMTLPADVYDRVKDRPVRMEMDYSLTLMKAGAAPTMPALEGNAFVPDVGRCATRMVPGYPQFELGCIAPGKPPCFVWFLAGHENSPCQPDYAPWFLRPSMSRFGSSFPLQDPADESRLKSARVLFRIYQPEAHFTRHVVIPDIRLSDWTAQ